MTIIEKRAGEPLAPRNAELCARAEAMAKAIEAYAAALIRHGIEANPPPGALDGECRSTVLRKRDEAIDAVRAAALSVDRASP
jgi:hypothetical protein